VVTRAILIVLDSVGCGGAEDARAYGDEGADTLGHIAEACADGRGDREGLRRGPLKLPRLEALGLGHAMKASTSRAPPSFVLPEPRAQWGYGIETSRGKDTPSGHWELAGTPVDFDWGYFPETIPAFPPALTAALTAEGKLAGILANRHASGTAVIEDYGDEHLRTLKPICYTSADSVLQIAAHEQAFGLERLYDLCRIARRLCDPVKIGRVIARPFLGASAKDFARTGNRKDFGA
jgi:phosphopentomutase